MTDSLVLVLLLRSDDDSEVKRIKKAIETDAAKPDGDVRSMIKAHKVDSLAEREFAHAWAEYTLALRSKGAADGTMSVQRLKVMSSSR